MVKDYIPTQECYTNSVCFPDNYYRLYNTNLTIIFMGECFFLKFRKLPRVIFSQKKGVGGVFLTKVEKYYGTFLMMIL